MTPDWLEIFKTVGLPVCVAAFLAWQLAKSSKSSGGQIDRLISVNQELVKANIAQDERLKKLESGMEHIAVELGKVGTFDPDAIAKLVALAIAKPSLPPAPVKRLRARKEKL